MRCDQLLNRLCLFRTRSQAAKACHEGRVRVNGRAARASQEIRPGDRISWQDLLGRYEQEIEVLEIPAGAVSKADARALYRTLSRTKLDALWDRPVLGGEPEDPDR